MQKFLDAIEEIIRANSPRDWLLVAAVFLATFLVVPFIRGRIKARQQRWTDIHSPALELLALLAARTKWLVLLSAALFFAENLLTIPDTVDEEIREGIDDVFRYIIVVGIAVQMAIWSITALRFAIDSNSPSRLNRSRSRSRCSRCSSWPMLVHTSV